MTIVSTGTFAGEEARGNITVSQHDDGPQIAISDLWVSPEAPDARLYVSPGTDGEFTEAAIELAVLVDGEDEASWNLPQDLDLATVRSVLIYCKEYSVMFGTAILTPSQSEPI